MSKGDEGIFEARDWRKRRASGIAWYININWEKRVIARSERYKKVGEQLERIENILKGYAKQDPAFAEILKKNGLIKEVSNARNR